MTEQNHADLASARDQGQWVVPLAGLFAKTQQSPESRMRTMVSCDIRSGRQSIYVPPDMAELQPRSLRYLHVFARQHDLQLVEDRRRVAVQPVREKRNSTSPVIAKALGQLLQQLGMPGDVRALSSPHRLGADSQHISISRLIRMAAFAAPKAKHAQVLPNRSLIDVLDNDHQAINAYGCKLVSADSSTVLSHFDSPNFRAIGYSAGKQYVIHVCMAGGPLSDPSLWASFHTLTRADFQFQLFNAQNPRDDMGLFYATFYLDVSQTPSPWWLNTWADTRLVADASSEPVLLKRAG